MVVFAGVGYAAACVYLWARQREIIFLPTPIVLHTPAQVGATYQPLSIPVGAAGFVAAWWLPSTFAQSAPAAVLYLHGNEGNLAREADRLDALRRLELPILAIDYRGYGQSSGPAPSEARVYDDAAAAWDYLIHIMGLDPAQVVIYGHSLGGAVAAELALRQPGACAIVLESTFTSMADMGRLRYPMFPIDWLLNQRFDAVERVGRLRQPIVLVHGTHDDIVPVAMGERLLAVAREPKRLVLVHGAGHEDALQNAGQQLHESIKQLVQECGRSR
jgi:pimeloyl-ACP methyl ester carboxylesterase